MIRVNISREMNWLESSDLKNCDIVVPSHILEALTKRITSMLAKLKRPYIIDPHTYIFGADVSHIDGKRWFGKLVAQYGLDVIIPDPDNFELQPKLLVDNYKQPTDNLRELVENVIDYQRTKIQETYDDINEIENFDQENIEIQNFKPKWIIPPYFFVSAYSKDWLPVNVNSIKLAVKNRNVDEKIFAVIMIDKEMLPFEEDIDEIVAEYNIDGVDGYLIWCASFNENSAKQRELLNFQKFIEKLAIYKKPIHNMYGGLFSLLLQNKGMMGTTHSICYGEYRNPFNTGGGGAIVRFYQPYLHSKLPFARLEEIETALQLTKCDCKYCDTLNDKKTKGRELELSGKHFILKRIDEINEINTAGADMFLKKLVKVNSNAKQKDSTDAYLNLYERFEFWNETINQREN